VAFDGQHHSEFIHRAAYSAANALQIKGGVSIASVEFKNLPAPHGHQQGFYSHRLQAINPVNYDNSSNNLKIKKKLEQLKKF
jgi:Galactoside-binding lectin